jgi:hypothetical protein
MTHAEFQAWLDRYVAAWRSNDAGDIAALFAEDAEYLYHPADEPVRGRDAIVAAWLDNPDAPGTADGQYEPLAIDGENHVAHGWSRYFTDGQLSDEYWNIFLCRFDDAGRCTYFCDWWLRGRQFASS